MTQRLELAAERYLKTIGRAEGLAEAQQAWLAAHSTGVATIAERCRGLSPSETVAVQLAVSAIVTRDFTNRLGAMVRELEDEVALLGQEGSS